jgi:hypothetical protein
MLIAPPVMDLLLLSLGLVNVLLLLLLLMLLLLDSQLSECPPPIRSHCSPAACCCLWPLLWPPPAPASALLSGLWPFVGGASEDGGRVESLSGSDAARDGREATAV